MYKFTYAHNNVDFFVTLKFKKTLSKSFNTIKVT